MKEITKKEWADKKKHGYASIIDDQRYILTMKNGATCLMPVTIMEKPQLAGRS